MSEKEQTQTQHQSAESVHAMKTSALRWLRAEYITVACLGIVLLIILAFDTTISPLIALPRALLSIFFMLFLPGYYLQFVLLPRVSETDPFERAAISIGLSAALLPPIAFLINLLGFRIDISSIIIFLYAVLIILGTLSYIRRARLLHSGTETWLTPLIALRTWWGSQSSPNRRLILVLGFSVVLMLVAVVIFLGADKPREYFTEFYVVGESGEARGYPSIVEAGQPITLTVGTSNNEAEAVTYRVEAQDSGQIIGMSPPFELEPGETIEFPFQFTPQNVGTLQRIEILLLRENDTPYRRLEIFANVQPREG